MHHIDLIECCSCVLSLVEDYFIPTQTKYIQWNSLDHLVSQWLCSQWDFPYIDAFATYFNHKLPFVWSMTPHPCSLAVNAFKPDRQQQCGVCNAASSNLDEQHPIENAIDGTNRWWQSPTLQNGKHYERVTITLDLKQVYQIAYVIIKAATSPRPGNWILERSLDGVNYNPWQYHAISEAECWEVYGIRPTVGLPRYRTDNEVICTSYYSKLDPLENGEIHISLVNGRPGADGPSETLRKFTTARFIRLRLEKIRTLNADLMTLHTQNPHLTDKSVTRRYFYSMKDISIGGQCVCYGHAGKCPVDPNTGEFRCLCKHNTCGDRCDHCCPLYNQRPWRAGTSKDAAACEKCECFGHADECYYDENVASKNGSLNTRGHYKGGGVCVKCKHHTVGVNCETCEDGYYRPSGVSRWDINPCRKCNCSGPGSTGSCIKDDSHTSEELLPGDCICHIGYAEKKCDKCAPGFRSYPQCEPCPCLFAGTISGTTCEGDCVCKLHVEGPRCDRCKSGHYNLDENNLEGCSPCFCSGVTHDCKESDWSVKTITEAQGWLVSDIKGSQNINALYINEKFSVGADEVPDLDNYYWKAPPAYLGNKLYSYGSNLTFITSYFVPRGDTSGMYTGGPDIILKEHEKWPEAVTPDDTPILGNGIRIGSGWEEHKEEDNVTLSVPLREQEWYQLTQDDKPDSKPVDRETFSFILNNLEYLLVRAKYHTEQMEGLLHETKLEIASQEVDSVRKMTSVEKCKCPPGYAGLSCERFSLFGAVDFLGSSHSLHWMFLAQWNSPQNLLDHLISLPPETRANLTWWLYRDMTTVCSPGYRRINNNFLKGTCEKCDCHNHALSCDPLTGQCETCIHNTTGRRCGRCKKGFYGNAKIGLPGDCKPCACPLENSENNLTPCETTIDAQGRVDYICTKCPIGYEGNKCEMCADGFFGNPLVPGSVCQPCDCNNNVERKPGFCDRFTGKCLKCLYNTHGWNCEKCLEEHYGDALKHNCKSCECNPIGSEIPLCNPDSGQCRCKTNFTGRQCDRCIEGHGNMKDGCVPCQCNKMGSKSDQCDFVTGYCICQPGVFGVHCDRCLDGFYGFSRSGCKECGCDKSGSESPRCDEIRGNCYCKHHVIGRACDKCQSGYWNIKSGKGCQLCNCDSIGSSSSECDITSGQCNCKPGVRGKKCDHCLPGYYGLTSGGCKECDPCNLQGHMCDPENGRCVCPPNTVGDKCQFCDSGSWGYDPILGCKLCNCSNQGSIRQTPACDEKTGKCTCLEEYEGRRCDRCRHGYYSFPKCQACDCLADGTMPSECMPDGLCLCDEAGQCPCRDNTMGRKCDQCRVGTFGLHRKHPEGCIECFCFGRTKNCKQAEATWSKITMNSRQATLTLRGDTHLSMLQTFVLIPNRVGDVTVGIKHIPDKPIYWNLPDKFLGDKVLAYNGELVFSIESHGQTRFPNSRLNEYPLVVLQGNVRLALKHLSSSLSLMGRHTVRFHEDEWKRLDNSQLPVTRDMMMVVLQKLEAVLIRATEGPDAKLARLNFVSMQVATQISSHFETSSKAIGVEDCRCPPHYTGLSCQDPSDGFYRKRKPNFLDSRDILDLVGWAEPCDCNNKTTYCDKETSVCINCTSNTSGPHCELCAPGYYGDPRKGPCYPCACPLPANSFSDTCQADGSDYICTNCLKGYTGRRCERCEDGYYGSPMIGGGTCRPCICNAYGSRNRVCDKRTGQCSCIPGITGRDCSVCQPRYVLTEIQVDAYQDAVNHGQKIIGNFSYYYDLETWADNLHLRAKGALNEARPIADDASKTLERSKEFLNLIEELWDDILNTVQELKNYGLDPSRPGVSFDDMLSEAEKILQEIRARDFTPISHNAEEELRRANILLDKVKGLKMDLHGLDGLQKHLDKLKGLLNEMLNIIKEEVQKPTEKARSVTHAVILTQNQIKEDIEDSTKIRHSVNTTLSKAEELVNLARQALEDAVFKFKELARLQNELLNATENVEEKHGILALLNPKYKEKFVVPAQEHAEELWKQAQQLQDRFSATKEVSDLPLKAAKAYKDIVDALTAAENAAREAETAAERAYNVAYPGTDDALTKQAEIARTRSEKLLKEAADLRDEIPKLRNRLEDKKNNLKKIQEDNAHCKINLDVINNGLSHLPNDIGENLSRVEGYLSGILDQAEQTHTKIDDIQDKIDEELIPRFEALNTGSVAELGNISDTINRARASTFDIKRQAENMERLAKTVESHHRDTQMKLKELKNKIKFARQMASSLKVSITTDSSGKCKRSYQPQIEPSTVTNIILKYALTKEEDKNSLLFYLANPVLDDFMAIEMVNRKVNFLWNVGDDTEAIQHGLNLEANDEQLSNKNYWYIIEVNRIGNIATLTVKSSSKNTELDPYKVQGHTSLEYTKMNLNSSSLLYIGGLPSDTQIPRQLQTRSFAGCLYEVKLDGSNVGLWNFLTNEGCTGCKEGETEQNDYQTYRFIGGGYAIFNQPKLQGFTEHNVILKFKTFDENALLFFTANHEKVDLASSELNDERYGSKNCWLIHFNFRHRSFPDRLGDSMPLSLPVKEDLSLSYKGQFVSIELREGKIFYQASVGPTFSRLVLSTTKTFNTGEFVHVKVRRDKNTAQLKINEIVLEAATDDWRNNYKIYLTTNTKMYYGGVPPNFSASSFPDVGFKSFHGCMRDLQIGATTVTLNTESYNLSPQCADEPIKLVRFRGAGYLEMKSQILEKESNFSFTFQTKDENALLMLSTFEGSDEKQEENNYYSVAVVNGKLETRLNAGKGEVLIQSIKSVNDGEYHTVTLLKTKHVVKLRLDDEKAGRDERVSIKGLTIRAPQNGGLYFGGVRSSITVTQMTATTKNLTGVIKDLIFNNRLYPFNDHVQFVGVGIGHSEEENATRPITDFPLLSQGMKECADMGENFTEKHAVKFGNALESYIFLRLKRRAFRKNFKIEFGFRTYHSNGLLMYVHNGRKKHSYLAVVLREGFVVVSDKKSWELGSHGNLYDGQWHSVVINKSERKLYLTVDDKDTQSVEVPQKLHVRPLLYVGGVPRQLKLDEGLVKESVRGCIRSLHINDEYLDLAAGNPAQAVSQCFAEVEPGAYFSGDAYAIYDRDFNLGSSLNVYLEFKTIQLNAVLLSFSDGIGAASFSIELNNGKVIVTISTGKNMEPIQAMKSFMSKYDLCDNMWHQISVEYKENTVSLKVDREDLESGVSKSESTPSHSHHPLYIGGLPERAHKGMLQIQDNFKGCLRNVSINNKQLNWVHLDELQNVLPDSCPSSNLISI
ncbi:laminin subunit alpha-1-like [Tachypleus tridentatus]|uniref:laminin subunit alpha-1-like n=1 Tax=Tachypleus tridentatus TaxID=6853 RepID=UPI003FD31366